jgi:hypothetical protein
LLVLKQRLSAEINKWIGGSIVTPVSTRTCRCRTITRDVCDGYSIGLSAAQDFQQVAGAYWDTSPYNDNRAEDEPSREMIIGRAAHHLMMGEVTRRVFALRRQRCRTKRAC